ncbi:helix-turn-helix domain-containing protein [Bacteroides caecicola]
MLPRIGHDKSVKEVANEAGFDNLSFFGKYVRRELGVSPRKYRLKKDI